MWQIVGLQCLVAGGAIVALFLKQTPDFDPRISVILGIVTIVSAILSVMAFMSQDKDVHFLKRNIETLVCSITLDAAVRDSIVPEIGRQSGALGLHSMKVMLFSNDLSAFSLYQDDGHERAGLLLVGRSDFNRFAIVDDPKLPSTIKGYLEAPLGKNPSGDWNAMVKEFVQAAQYVVSELSLDPDIVKRIWADEKKGSVGLATERHLQRPNITFDRERIGEFRTLRRVDRHHRLARMIELAVQPEFLDIS
jgi:hypothetical protein